MPTPKQIKAQKKNLEKELAAMFQDVDFDSEYLTRHDISWPSGIGWRPWFESVNYTWFVMNTDSEKTTAWKGDSDPRYREAVQILTNLYQSYLESRGRD